MKKNETTMVDLNPANLLAIVFVVLKLTGVINWSWWWVLSPIWIVWGVSLLLIIIAKVVLFFHDD